VTIFGFVALLLSVGPRLAAAGPATLPSTLPKGVPSDAEEATFAGYVDGDKVRISVDGSSAVEILLAGIDAPEKGECYRSESVARMEELLEVGDTIYLEQSGVNLDGKDRPIRYLWIPSNGDGKASLLNTKMVREGYAGFDDRKDNPKYYDRLEELQAEAKANKVGLWGACGGVHEVPKPKATKTPVPPTPTAAPTLEPTPTEDPNANAGFGLASQNGCDPSYPDVCIPPISQTGDLDCGDVGFTWFTVVPPDPHNFDRDGDGYGCES
jgi:micrococcal nuclease